MAVLSDPAAAVASRHTHVSNHHSVHLTLTRCVSAYLTEAGGNIHRPPRRPLPALPWPDVRREGRGRAAKPGPFLFAPLARSLCI